MDEFVPVPARLPFEIFRGRNPEVALPTLITLYRAMGPEAKAELDSYAANDQRRLVADYDSWRSTRPWAPSWERYIEQRLQAFHRDYIAIRDGGSEAEEARKCF